MTFQTLELPDEAHRYFAALHFAQPVQFSLYLSSGKPNHTTTYTTSQSTTILANANNRYDLLFVTDGAPILDQAAESILKNQILFQENLQNNIHNLHDLLSDLPFCGGYAFYAPYELVHQFERITSSHRKTNHHYLYVWRAPAALIYDRLQNKNYVIFEKNYPNIHEIMTNIQNSLRVFLPKKRDNHITPKNRLANIGIQTDVPENFIQQVEAILEYLCAGDVMQVNLSRAWHIEFAKPPNVAEIWQNLHEANPNPFAASLYLGGQNWILSTSPERLVRVKADHIDMRPIAGTRPRGTTPQEDANLQAELQKHPKELAEHIMLIDLIRNDLGRVCAVGSVQVDELMTVEKYAHVQHLVSNVCGKLAQPTDVWSILRAVFPGGTITGCPKVRCMEIIDELEATPRGAYTGSLGYVDHAGQFDSNILIRTLTIADKMANLRAGAGIVMDSIPDREVHETEAKARGILRVLSQFRN